MLLPMKTQLLAAAASFIVGLLSGWAWLLLKPSLGPLVIKHFGRKGGHSLVYLVGGLTPLIVVIPAAALLIVISRYSLAEPLVISGSFVVAYMVTKFAAKGSG